MHEFELIQNFFSILSKNNKSALDLNDDVFFDKKNKNVISVDTYIEKIHFPNFKDPNLLIKKIIRSSISDLICKGVVPKFYFISGSGNKHSFSKKNIKKNIREKNFYLGDIAISHEEFLKKNSEDYKNGFIKLFIHGFLHLLNFDHKLNKDYKVMQSVEKKIYQMVKGKVELQK